MNRLQTIGEAANTHILMKGRRSATRRNRYKLAQLKSGANVKQQWKCTFTSD
jgi:hypothetical protein